MMFELSILLAPIVALPLITILVFVCSKLVDYLDRYLPDEVATFVGAFTMGLIAMLIYGLVLIFFLS